MARGTTKTTTRGVTSVDVQVGARLRAIRTNQNMSQEALGDKLGVSFQQIQKYEKGMNRVSLARAVEMAKVLNTSVDELLGTGATPLNIVTFNPQTYALAGSLMRLEGLSKSAATQFRALIEDLCDHLERSKKKRPA